MNRRTWTVVFLLVGTLFLRADGCLKDKVLDVVVTSETSAGFAQNETSASFQTTPAVIDLNKELDKALADAGFGRGDIKRAQLRSAHYGATSLEGNHDWTISGAIEVARVGATLNYVTLLKYTSQSVKAALGQKIPAELQDAGVTVMNQAIDDYLNGQPDVALAFRINNGETTPQPSVVDPMQFDWKAWVGIYIVVPETVKNVPDPF